MNVKHQTPAELCRELARGWTAAHAEAPRELIARLCGRWQSGFDSESPQTSAYRAVLALNHVRLLGASEMGCLVLGGGAAVEREVTEFWQQHGGGGRLALVLAATTALKDAARQFVSPDRCVFLGDGELEPLFLHPQALELLKEHLRRQIPLRRLLPYDIIHPVAPNMFFGRRDLLDRIRQEETTSFAIAGPGRIGKSSLLKQYAHELRCDPRDDRRHRLFAIDCYPYAGLDADAIASRIALDISADSEAHRVNALTLVRFLKRHSRSGAAPLELLLDEVDGVCQSKAFEELAEAVRLGYCRVLLCGKGTLYRTMRQQETQFSKRLQLIRPEPLDPDSAGRLLLEPLAELGFAPENAAALRQQVFALTARRPHLIQECARLLFDYATADQTKTLTACHLEQLREEFLKLSHAMLSLEDMADDLTRLLALLWLRSGGGPINVGTLQKLADPNGVTLTAAKALDICDDLWIANVLTWEKGAFSLASPYLVEWVRRMDFSKEIERLKSLATQRFASRATYAT